MGGVNGVETYEQSLYLTNDYRRLCGFYAYFDKR